MPTTTLSAYIGMYSEVELSIEYQIFGDYRPATRFDPPEEPEMEVESVKAHGQEIPDWMCSLLEGEIHDACWEHAGRVKRQQKEQADDARADYWDAIHDQRREEEMAA